MAPLNGSIGLLQQGYSTTFLQGYQQGTINLGSGATVVCSMIQECSKDYSYLFSTLNDVRVCRKDVQRGGQRLVVDPLDVGGRGFGSLRGCPPLLHAGGLQNLLDVDLESRKSNFELVGKPSIGFRGGTSLGSGSEARAEILARSK